MSPRSIFRSLRSLGFLAMLLPFAALSLIAQGVMPARSAAGTVMMVLCTTEGPVATVFDLATGQPVHVPAATDDRCAWAGAHPVFALNSPDPLPRRVLVHGPVTQSTAHVLWRPGFDPKGLHARGPPSLV